MTVDSGASGARRLWRVRTSPIDPLGGHPAIVEHHREGADEHPENRVVDRPWKQESHGVRDRAAGRRRGGEREDQHGVQQAQDRDGDEWRHEAEAGKWLRDERRASDGREEGERRHAERATKQRVKNDSSDEGPRDPPIDPSCDGPDDGANQNGVWRDTSDLDVRRERDLDESNDRRPDRSEKEAHGSAIGPRRAKGSRANLSPRGDERLALPRRS